MKTDVFCIVLVLAAVTIYSPARGNNAFEESYPTTEAYDDGLFISYKPLIILVLNILCEILLLYCCCARP